MPSPLYKLIQPTLHKMNTIRCSPADLLYLQIFDGEYCHPDTLVKYMYIENHYGKNDFGKDLYIKQQAARGVVKDSRAITEKFDALITSVESKGFDTGFSIGVDKNFYLRDGSHRSAMSLYLGLEEIRVNYLNMEYPRNYRYSWFADNGFTEEEINIIKAKEARIMNEVNTPLNIVLFGSSADEADEAAKLLSQYGTVISCSQYYPDEKQCHDICCNILKANILYEEEKNIKIDVKNARMAVIRLKLSKPVLKTVENNEPKIFKRFINYRLPVITQADEIRNILTDKTFINDKLLFIPLNFYQNHKFNNIINSYCISL